jgi:hypothetical protein
LPGEEWEGEAEDLANLIQDQAGVHSSKVLLSLLEEGQVKVVFLILFFLFFVLVVIIFLLLIVVVTAIGLVWAEARTEIVTHKGRTRRNWVVS